MKALYAPVAWPMLPYSAPSRAATTGPDSDLDILVEFSPGAEGTIHDYIRFKEFVASLFDAPVDVIDRAALKPYLRAPAAGDAVYAF
jgi:predicted nucleotidyltransferase